MTNDSQIRLPEVVWDLPFINQGISGLVYAIDERAAIKVSAGGEINRQGLEVERQILERLGEHPRIVKLLCVHRDMIVLERLQYPLRVRIQELPEEAALPCLDEILKWSAQAAEGMHYFNEKRVYQVDIGLHNMLLDWDENIKYCDFSGSSLDGMEPTAAASARAENPRVPFSSPTVESEIFALGSALYEISTTYKTYEDKEDMEIEELFRRQEYPRVDHLLLGHVILKCWTGENRTASEAATEIRRIQRQIKLGDLSLSLSEMIEQRKLCRGE